MNDSNEHGAPDMPRGAHDSLGGTHHPAAHRIETLRRALVEFDLANDGRLARRRLAKRACSVGVGVLAIAAILTWASAPAPGPSGPVVPAAHRSLPGFVEIITSDMELVQELDAAGSCEGIGRDGDHVFIVPCVASAATLGPRDWSSPHESPAAHSP